MTLIAELAGIPPAPIEPYPVTLEELHLRHPLQAWQDPLSTMFFEDTEFDGHWYTVVEPTSPPPTGWGEQAVEAPLPVLVDGTWRQAWVVEPITLDEAKMQLAQMAIEIYWTKMDAVPTVQELTNAAGSYAAVKTARETRFKPKLLQVRNDIQALQPPATVADAYTIYLQLEALP